MRSDRREARHLIVAMALSASTLIGCKSKNDAVAANDGSAPTMSSSSSASARSGASTTKPAARFSAPIAAAHATSGGVYVAGLVVPDKAIAVTRIEANGTTSWTRNILDGVAWSGDADVRVFPAGDGALVLWRGPRNGKNAHVIVNVSAKGDVVGAPVDVGAATCATDTEIAWSQSSANGPTAVRVRALAGGDVRDAASIPVEREPILVCGARRIFVFGEGDDDTNLRALDQPKMPPIVAFRDADFGNDFEREHNEYTVGDDLGIVRVGASGGVAMRELHGTSLSPWRATKMRIPSDDDIVALDADANSAYLFFTRDASSACTDGGATSASSVHALRIDRATGVEATLDLAPADCARDVGPFWTGTVASGLTIGWAERVHKVDPTSAPIAGIAFRTIENGVASALKRIARPSDRIVDAGCDATHCYAVALARAPGTDDMLPEVAQVIAYP
jgi:hypothetical protein